MERNSTAYCNKIQKQSSFKLFKVKGKDIPNPIGIATAFDNYFIETGPNLSKTIPRSSKPFRNLLKNSSLNSFLLRPTSEDKVHQLISQLNKGKALDPVSIPVKVLKGKVNISSNPLNFIMNRSFEQGPIKNCPSHPQYLT